jgi:hypothetical protein
VSHNFATNTVFDWWVCFARLFDILIARKVDAAFKLQNKACADTFTA